jgi:Protein of unknown function DUF262/Protein of unknown function (DUF1524)
MASTSFNTTNSTYRQLIGNGLTYRVPPFQRDYSWREEEWDDLWQDLLETLRKGGEPSHYMGYLVLQSIDGRNFDVVDGQQRMTTLSLIILAVLKNLSRLSAAGIDSDRNNRRAVQLRNTYVGYLDPVSLVPRSKLTLSRNNDRYYQTWLVPLTEQLPVRGFRDSEHQLRRAFLWFDKRVSDWMQPASDKGESLAQFVESMSDKLFFTVITVADELNAYKVFETLNSRGVRLSVTDLLKNYLFSIAHRGEQPEAEMQALEDRWDTMTARLGEEKLTDFLRVHWNSRRPSVRQSELFKLIRERVKERRTAFELLREMEEDIDSYLALTNPENSGLPSDQRDHIDTLRMFGVRQPFPLLMAIKRVMTAEDFATALRAITVISFRYNIIGSRNTGDQERVYHHAAGEVAAGSLNGMNSVLQALAEIYPSDAEFRASFTDKAIRTSRGRNSRIVRYIFAVLERQFSQLDVDAGSAAISLEHVLPQNPGEGWEHFTENALELDALVHRLGNVTFLEAALNKELGNGDFKSKSAVYPKSQFHLTRKIADDNDSWTIQRIERRQQQLAALATAAWRIAQLADRT